MTAVAELVLRSPIEPWQRVGLRVEDGRSWIGGTCLRFVDAVGEPAIVGWTLVGSPSTPSTIDGLATEYLDEVEPQSWAHPLGATTFDHVVVNTSSIERTCGEIERATGEPLKRIRDAGPSIRQGFHRLGSMIVEVVESPRFTGDVATFWGFVLVVDDLFEAAERLGPDVMSMPKQAVQPGRLISSFRAEVGLGLPIALMSPHVR
jgi:hypothetical protein